MSSPQKEAKVALTKGKPYKSSILKLKAGRIFSDDALKYYEVTSKFGDPPSLLRVFEITESGSKKYLLKEELKFKTPEDLSDWLEDNGMIEVTECIPKNMKSFDW